MQKIYLTPNLRINENKTISPKKVDSIGVQTHTNSSQAHLNSFNKYLVNFTGLNRTLSKRAFTTAEAVKAEVAKHVRSKGIIGNLPKEWVDKIPKTQRAEKIKKLYAEIKQSIKSLRDSGDINICSAELKDSLHRAGLVEENANLELKKLGKGAYGTGYRLRGVLNDECVIKVFISNDSTSYRTAYSSLHGNYIESNRAAYWQKNAGKNTQKVGFHFGDIDAGYIVMNKYIDYVPPACKKSIPEELYGLAYDSEDKARNSKFGYDIEFGNLEIISELANNKTARYVYKKLSKLPEEQRLREFVSMHWRVQSQKNPDMIVALASAIELLPRSEHLNQLKKFSSVPDNRVKAALAYRFHLLCSGDYVPYFNKIIEGADNRVKKILVKSFSYLPKSERCEQFKKLAENADDELKELLVEKVISLPKSDRIEHLALLTKGASDKVMEDISRKMKIYGLRINIGGIIE